MLKEATHPQCGSTLGSCHDRLAYVNSFALDVFLFHLSKCFYDPRRLCCLLISQDEYSKPHTQLLWLVLLRLFQMLFPGSRDNGWLLLCIQWAWHRDRCFKRLEGIQEWINGQSPFCSSSAAGSLLGGDVPLSFYLPDCFINPSRKQSRACKSIINKPSVGIWQQKVSLQKKPLPHLCGLAPNGLFGREGGSSLSPRASFIAYTDLSSDFRLEVTIWNSHLNK